MKVPTDPTEFVNFALVSLGTTGVRILIVILLSGLAVKGSRLLSDKIFALLIRGQEGTELKKRADTLSSVVRWVLLSAILGITSMIVLQDLGFAIGPILAGAGVVGVAVGFGAQTLVKDVITGFFILMEDQIRVGDVVEIADKSGVVERVTLRMVTLRDLSGNVHFVRNSDISVVTNMTKDFSYYVFEVGVAYKENVDSVIEVLQQIDESMRQDPDYKNDIIEPLEILGLDKFADSAIILKARTKTLPIRQWRVGREFNRRIKNTFDKLNIEIPFPHTTVYMGADKAGQAPPLPILVENALSASPN
ncbi:mechanosensitive ion channel family protein [Candidatus Obscuribacterales bacterium]|nr:mechanosensitive ion channel family protein [Candidatus Obscuribacterales bacterium]